MKSFLLTVASLVVIMTSLTSCSDNNEPEAPSITKDYVGNFEGTVTLAVAGRYNYSTQITCAITASDAETITVAIPEYSLPGTMMGDLTVGALTITGLTYDEAKGGFYRNYGGQGLKQHLKAEQNGKVTMDSDYPLNDESTILVTVDKAGKLTIENPFQLGAMPLPLKSEFTGVRK